MSAAAGDTAAGEDGATAKKEMKNSDSIFCPLCPSKVLAPGTASTVSKKVFLPNFASKSAIPKSVAPKDSSDSSDVEALYFLPDVEGEVLEDFLVVSDMYTFENVGFSNTVGTVKYLTCADCERGPIGYHDTKNPKEFFIARKRVRTEVK